MTTQLTRTKSCIIQNLVLLVFSYEKIASKEKSPCFQWGCLLGSHQVRGNALCLWKPQVKGDRINTEGFICLMLFQRRELFNWI